MSSSIQRSNEVKLSVLFPFQPWNVFPGDWIRKNEKNTSKAEALFRQFVQKKVPTAMEFIKELNNAKCFSPIHLPMNISSIFFTYVNEQIELYQNQRDTRDLEVDQKFQDFKEFFAKERYKLCMDNSESAVVFFKDLKIRLELSDVLAPDFDEVVTSWLRLMSIVHIGDMHLGSFFLNTDKTGRLDHGPNIKMASAELMSADIQSSFHLVLKQFAQDLKWVSLKLKDKMFLPEKHDLQVAFFTTIQKYEEYGGDIKKPKEFQTPEIYTSAPSFIQNDFQHVLHDLSLINFDDNEAINSAIEKLLNIKKNTACYIDLTNNIKAMEEPFSRKRQLKLKDIGEDRSGCIDYKQQDVNDLMKKRQECHLLMDAFFEMPCKILGGILKAFKEFNLKVQECKNRGDIPHFIAKPILPPSVLPASPQFNEKVCRELLDSSSKSVKASSQQNKKGLNTPQKSLQNSSKDVEKKKNHSVDQKETVVPIASKELMIPEEPVVNPVISPLMQLRNQFLKIYNVHPFVSVRQSLWHLDALITLQDALKAPQIKKEESLGILNMAVSSAHKLLEQSYRFQLDRSNVTTLSSHNLKDFYRAANNNSSYPEIVRELFLASHWTRYFFLEKEKWSFTTHAAPTPPLLLDLVNLAEGKPLQGKVQLKQKVEEIIEKTRACVETILPHIDVPLPPTYVAEDLSIELKTSLNPNIFNETKNSLSTLLKKSTFPAHSFFCLSLKQGIASLSMLKANLQKMQGIKNPRELATWTSQCVLQAQESMENILHAIEYLKEGQASTEHELNVLSKKVGLDMGSLGNDYQQLSYKPRYPAENINNGLGAQIIDDVEALRQYPGCADGFKHVGPTPMLWTKLNENLSAKDIVGRLISFLKSSELFLRKQAIPALTVPSQPG